LIEETLKLAKVIAGHSQLALNAAKKSILAS